MIVIRRGKNLRYESAVDVFQADHGHWTIDPAQEMFDATKLHISRYNCIISFSAGISAAGHPVFIEKNRRGLGDVLERFEQRGRTITFCYFLLGLAWVRNEWDAIKRMLAKVSRDPAFRLSILEETGKYYLEHPFYNDPIRLQIPIGS